MRLTAVSTAAVLAFSGTALAQNGRLIAVDSARTLFELDMTNATRTTIGVVTSNAGTTGALARDPADRYPTMKPDQKERLQQRMQDWAKLSPEERRAAREKYQTLRKQPPKKREEVKRQWDEYEQSRAASAAPATPAAAENPPAAQ